MTKAKNHNTKTNKSTSTRDLRLEALENRQLLSVSPANISTEDLIPAYTAPAEIDAEPQVTFFTEDRGGGQDVEIAPLGEIGQVTWSGEGTTAENAKTCTVSTLDDFLNAIDDVNAAGDNYYKITIAVDDNTVWTLTKQIEITGNVEIDGDGVTFDRGLKGKEAVEEGRIFDLKGITVNQYNEVSKTYTVSLSNMTLTGGNVAAQNFSDASMTTAEHQRQQSGGAIRSEVNLTLNNVKITENVTTSANSNCGGGGIYVAYGTSLTMTDCEISGNSSLGKDGGDCYGGAILSSGALNLKNVNIVGNYAEDNGGAIADYAPANWSSVPKCPRVYDNVRMTGNYTTGWGGAIYDGTGSTTGTITIQNSVITGNEAVKGGDDLCDNSKNENTATYNVFDVSNSVIGTISGRGSSSEVEVAYVKNNENGNAIGVEASAIFTTWETPTTTNTGVNYDSSKISAETIPMETPETGTMYRFVGVSKNTLTEHPDISTYYQIGDVAYPKTYVEAYASFEEAIDAANNGDTIIYLGTKDTITLNSEITIDKALTIDGNGVTIDRGLGNMVIDANADHVANGHIFVITTAAGTTMTLKNMTLTGACQYDDNSYGGAIDFKGGNLVCTNVNFTNNRAIAGGVGAQGTDPKYSSNIGQGGAINMSGEDLTLTNCTFDNNDATRAGSCIYFSGGQKGNPYTLTMTDCEVKNSDASSASWHTNSGGWGTVYLNGGSLVADKVNFTNNKTVAQGSAYAVESYTGSVDIKNSTIEGNTQNIGAVVSVWCEPTSVNIENTKIINNTVTTGTAKDAGLGGLAVAQADSLTISDSTITGNTAADMDADLYVASTVTNVNTNASSNTIGSNLSSASDVVVSVSKGSYTVNDNEIIIAEDGDYAFSMPEGATAADVSIVVKDGVTANITLNNVNLAPTDAAAMSIIEGSTVNLTLKGENTLKGDDVTSGGGYAAIHVEGIALDYSGNPIDPNAHHASLTITEDSGTDLTADKEANPNGKLLAIGGWATSYGHGAGIGSNAGKGAGNITINGGYIEAYDGITYEDKINNTENKNKYWWGAPAIGCAGYTSGHTFATSEVTISNGVVYAWGGPCAAAIGDGNNVSATDITITGGLVNAYACKANVDGSTAAAGAAIGAGDNGTNGYISITGGTVNAYSEAGAGIGSGNGAGCSDISITGGTVTAIGGSFTSGNTIYGAAGIGNGIGTGWAGSYQSGTIFIGKDATVYAKAGGSTLEDGADIGLSSLHGSNVLEGWITVIYEEGANIYQDSTGTKASIGFNGDEQNSYVAVQTENSDGIAGIQYKFWNHSAVGYDMEINPVSTRDCTIYAVPGSAFMIGETYYIAKTEPDADNMIITFKDGVVVDVQNEKEIVTQIVPEAGNRIHFVATTLPELEEIAGGEYYRINGDVYWKGYVNATVYDTLEELEAALDDFQVDKDGNPTNEPVIKAGDTVIIGGSYIASETETFTLNKDLVFRNDNTKDNGVAKIVNLGSINLTDGASLTIDENLVVNSLTAGNVTVTKATNLTMKEGDITLTVENFVVNSEGSVEITSGNVNVTGKGEVTINGTENNDVVSVGANTINVDGVSSTTFTDFTGSKTVKGNEGNDVVVVDSAVTENISIEGNDGNDVIISSGTAVTIDGGTGSDLIIDGTVTKLDSVKKWTSNASYAKALELYATGAIVKSSLTNTATINTGDSDTTLDIVFALEEEEETDLITMGTEDLLFPQHVEKTKGVIVVTTGDAQYWGMDDEHITLNEAIAWTNASTVYNTIGFAVDVNNVVVGGNLLTITDTLTIDGASKYDEFGVKSEVTTFAASDVVIDGQNTYSLFNIAAGETVSMNDLTITGGVGTTIPNDSNEAEKWGGGIYNAGTLTLTNIDITNNTATYGGGVYNKGTMTINGTSKISNNSSYQGGGIYNVGSKLHLTGATITGNEASGDGGGLWHVGQNYVYLNGVTIDQNSAINGGGVYNGGRIQLEGSYSSYGIQTKITNNTATGYGGGIYNKFSFVPGSSHTFMTISGNKASNGGGVYTTSSFSAKADINRNEATDGDGGGVYNTAALTLSSGSTISGNTTTRNGGGIYNNNQHSAGIVDAKISNNHADTGNGGGIYNSNQTNHPSNQKMELENTVISNNKASQNGGGIWNEVDNNVTLTNVTISGNNAELGGGVYNEGAVTISGGTIGGDTANTATANTATDGAGVYNTGDNATLTMNNNATISNNKATGNGGGLFNNSTSANNALTNVTISSNNAELGGGGVYNTGANATLTMTGTTISKNTAKHGGGIYNNDGGTIDASDATISYNKATNNGGGIYNYSGNITISGEISNNNAGSLGGGVFNISSFSNGGNLQIDENTATRGGGIWNNGALTLDGTDATVQISNNKATATQDANIGFGGGGGIHNLSTDMKLNTVTISNNTATTTGGGLYNIAALTNAQTNLTITGNSASNGAGVYNAANAKLTITNSQNAGIQISSNNATKVEGNDETGLGGGVYNAGVLAFKVTQDALDGHYVMKNNDVYGGGIYNAKTGTIQEGVILQVAENTASQDGGGIYNDGVIENVTLSSICENTAISKGGGIYNAEGAKIWKSDLDEIGIGGYGNVAQSGGGIYNAGTIDATGDDDYIMTGSNTATNGAGIYNATTGVITGYIQVDSNIATGKGGGIYNEGTIDTTNNVVLEVYRNEAVDGGGIYNKGTINAPYVDVWKNTASNNGGGVYNTGTNATLTMNNNATISNNTAANKGGGLYNEGVINGEGALTVGDEDNGGNTAAIGGGIYNASTGSITMTDSTIYNNEATNNGGGIYNESNGIITFNGSDNTISNNTATNNGGGVHNLGTFKTEDVKTEGSTDTEESTTVVGTITVKENTATKDGGGIYNAGNMNVKGNFDANIAGQYGGAIFNSGTFTMNDYSQIGTGNKGAINTAAINTAQDGAGVYNDANGELNLTKVDITANRATNDGGGLYNKGTANLIEVSFTNNHANNGAGIYNTSANLTLDNVILDGNTAKTNGGGLYNSAVLEAGDINNITVSNNKANNGAGIYNAETATFTNNSTLIAENNSASGNGGALFNAGEFKNESILSINGATAVNGAGIYNTGTVTLNGTTNTIQAAKANNQGGAIYNAAGAMLTATNVSLYGTIGGENAYDDANTAKEGAGLYNAGTANLTNATIRENVASEKGGAIYNVGTVTLDTLDGTNEIKDNKATNGAGIYNTVVTDGKGNVTATGTFTNNGTTTISGNIATEDGGAIYNAGNLSNATNAILTIGETDKANTAANGAGIYNMGTFTNAGTAQIGYGKASVNGGGIYNDGTINNQNEMWIGSNKAVEGAGIYNNGVITNTGNVAISANEATRGGGIYQNSTTVLELDDKYDISNNKAVDGAGIYVNTEINFKNTTDKTIIDNTATDKGGAIYVAENATLNVTDNAYIVSNQGTNGGGLYLDGTLTVAEGKTITFDSNNTTLNEKNYGGALYIGKNATYGDVTKTFTIDKQSDFVFTGNGTNDNTYGGAIYNAGTLNFACDYALGATVDSENNTITRNTEINNGIGAIYNVGTMTNQSASYGKFQAGSAEHSDLNTDKMLSEKTFSFFVANQNGDGVGNGGGTMTLSNAKIFANKDAGVVINGGTVIMEKGTEIGADQLSSATEGYKYYTNGFTGNGGAGVIINAGKLEVEQGEKNALYWNQWKSEEAKAETDENGRYTKYEVIDTVRISGNTGTGIIVNGGTVNLNDVRMEGNGSGMDVQAGTVNVASALISDSEGFGVNVAENATVTLTHATVAGNATNDLTGNGTVNLVNSIGAVSNVANVTDASNKGVNGNYNFTTDVLGNKYTLGAGSDAFDAGTDGATYTDGTEITSDLAGHDRKLYANVDLGAFENPVYWLMGDTENSDGHYLNDYKFAVENVADVNIGGAVKFDTSCNGHTFVWAESENKTHNTKADWIFINRDINIDARYLDEDGNYYWMDVKVDAGDKTGLFRVYKNGVTLNVYGQTIMNTNSSMSGGAVMVATESVANLYGMSFIDCHSNYFGGAIYGGVDAVINVYGLETDGYMEGTTANTKKQSTTYRASVFSGNTAWMGGAIYSENTHKTPTKIDNVVYENGLNIQGVDLTAKTYMDENGTIKTGVQYDSLTDKDTGAVKQYSVQFIDNQAADLGGAIYTQGNAIANIDGVSFINNRIPKKNVTGTYGGGAMYIGSAVKLNNADFLNNYSYTSGGAIVINGHVLSNGNLVFAGNSTEILDRAGAGTHNGGAIYLGSGSLTLNEMTRPEGADKENVPTSRELYKGGLSTNGGFSYEFLNNEAELGGAIETKKGTVNISDALFSRNLATAGGAMYNQSATVNLNGGIKITQNHATTYGGGLFGTFKTEKATDAEVSYNWASNGGGVWSNSVSDAFEGFVKDNYATVTENRYNNVYDASNPTGPESGEPGAAPANVNTDAEYYGKAGLNTVSDKITTNTEVNPNVVNSLTAVGNVNTYVQTTNSATEWDTIYAEARLDNATVLIGDTVTQTLTYDSNLFQLNLDTLKVADGWSCSISETTDENGMTTATLTFTAKTPEMVEKLVLANLEITPTGNGLEASTELFGITIEKMVYDMNQDGKVNINDLVQFARDFGSTEKLADFNEDGIVNINDLVKFAQNFGAEAPVAKPAVKPVAATPAITPVAAETPVVAETVEAPIAVEVAETPVIETLAAPVATPVTTPTVVAQTVAQETKVSMPTNAERTAELDTVSDAKAETVTDEILPVTNNSVSVYDSVFASMNDEEEDWLGDICSEMDSNNQKNILDDLFGNN